MLDVGQLAAVGHHNVAQVRVIPYNSQSPLRVSGQLDIASVLPNICKACHFEQLLYVLRKHDSMFHETMFQTEAFQGSLPAVEK